MVPRLPKLAAAAAGVLAVAGGATALAAGPPKLPTGRGGAKVQLLASGLKTPTSLAYGDGSVFEGDGGARTHKAQPPNGGVFVLEGGAAKRIAGSPQFVAGLAWHKGALYVSGGSVTGPKSATWTVSKWSGWNGTKFAHHKAIWTAPNGLQGLNGLGFAANGRLFVGVDTGLLDGNDHGPVTTSPDLYEVLSMKSNGSDVTTFASGIRQPWQFAFPKGSSSPFVSDLGQDAGAKNPPDFLLRLHKGDNYGFPACNWTAAAACHSFAKPFHLFPPHTDIMGVAIMGGRIYMTSFAGPGGKGPGGEVFSMPLAGGKLTAVVTGFVAPTVGLGSHGRSLYVGELTGQVFKVTP